MISATEARQLYTQPTLTREEIEQQIRRAALTHDYTCFDKARLSAELFGELQEAGYTVDAGADSFVVRWNR